VTAMPPASDAVATSADSSAGPQEPPRSDRKRHTARKYGRPWRGAKSAPSVMIRPEPMPLPKPIAVAAISNVAKPPVNGIASSATPMIAIDGTATQRRPFKSITRPAG